MPTATMTSKGQVTIPKEVRDALHLETGHRISFRVREDGIVEIRPENVDLMAFRGILKSSVKGVTIRDMKEAIRRGAIGE